MESAPWSGPPADMLGGAAPIQRFVVRTDQAVVALHHVIAFPTGCTFDVQVAVRRGPLDDSAWQAVVGTHGPGPWPSGSDLKFSVRLPDTDSLADNPPEAPRLFEVSSEAGHDARHYESKRRLWLWPLPPACPFEFVVEWHQVGLAPTATTVDGAAVVRAAELAEPYWP